MPIELERADKREFSCSSSHLKNNHLLLTFLSCLLKVVEIIVVFIFKVIEEMETSSSQTGFAKHPDR